VLKGSSLISRVYSRTLRFSWDIDLATPAPRKEELDLDVLSRRLRREERFSSLRLNGSELVLGLFERDEEKDVFMDLYSLRRPMTTYSVGAPLRVFVRSRIDRRKRSASSTSRILLATRIPHGS